MKIGGFQKLSLLDYPGRPAAVIFTQGCNFRCPFCHNPDLISRSAMHDNDRLPEITEYLAKRRKQIDGVVITGGEPTIQNGLPEFLSALKMEGYAVKLDTNGSRPEVLQNLIRAGLIDFIAMDVKAPPEKYNELSGTAVDISRIRESIRVITKSGLKHEFRTTLARPFLNEADVSEIVSFIGEKKHYTLQACNAENVLVHSEAARVRQYTEEEIKRNAMENLWERRRLFRSCKLSIEKIVRLLN